MTQLVLLITWNTHNLTKNYPHVDMYFFIFDSDDMTKFSLYHETRCDIVEKYDILLLYCSKFSTIYTTALFVSITIHSLNCFVSIYDNILLITILLRFLLNSFVDHNIVSFVH